MNKIFETERHLGSFDDLAWDLGVAESVIKEIVDESQSTFTSDKLWPVHPKLHQVPSNLNDIYDNNYDPEIWLYGIYSGAAGVVLGLRYIQNQLPNITEKINVVDMINSVKLNYFCFTERERNTSYFFGDAGIYFADWVINQDQRSFDFLEKVIQNNIDLPSNELFWGQPSLMIVCLHMYRLSEQLLWRDLFRKLADQLWSVKKWSEKYQCQLWVQDLDNCKVKHIGAGHGFAGNIHALLMGAEFLDEDMRSQVQAVAVQTLSQTKIQQNDLINWPQSVEGNRPKRTAMLLQWCHGAPGVVTAMKYHLNSDRQLDSLLIKAGETTWNAGPLVKSLGGLCHSSAGNGYAFLCLYKRTGEIKWLQRARVFAMSAIEGYRSNKSTYGMSKFSLWTGDVGIACYLTDCINVNTGIPTLDTI